MRILLASHSLGFGGHSAHLFTLAAAHVKAGHEAFIWTSVVDPMAYTVARWCGFDGGRLITRWDLEKTVRRQGIEVIDFSAPPNESFPSHDVRVPLVVTCHGRWANGRVIERARELVCVEEVAAEVMRTHHARVNVVPNMVDLARWPFAPGGEGVMGAGRCDDDVMTCLRELRGVTVDFYGAHPARRSASTERIRVFDASDLSSVYPRYKVLVGASQVIIEGMATGRACLVALDTDRLGRATARRGYDGWVTPENVARCMTFNYRGQTRPGWESRERDPREVEADIKRLLAMPMGELMATLEANRRWVERHHDADVNAARFREVYERAIRA